jgi:two-component system, NarL family, response regulator NreC
MPATMTLTVLLADDHEVVRTGLRFFLEREDDLEVVAEVGTADDALRRVRGHRPDVLVLDLNMPGRSGLEVLPEVVAASPDTRVLVLTMQESPAYARQALRAGARGYVLKEGAGAELVEAIRTVAAGGTYLTPSLGARLATEPDVAQDGRRDGVTARELEVLRLLVLGHTNSEVAELLHVSRRTVESHRASLQSKTGCATRAELVRYAVSRRLVDLSALDDA